MRESKIKDYLDLIAIIFYLGVISYLCTLHISSIKRMCLEYKKGSIVKIIPDYRSGVVVSVGYKKLLIRDSSGETKWYREFEVVK